MKRKKGSLAVDFMFGVSFLSIAFIFMILVGLSLVYAEVAQYVTYSSARNYFASHNNHLAAAERTILKYQELRETFFEKTNWFSIGIGGNPRSSDIFVDGDKRRASLGSTDERVVKGVYTEYTSKVFGMKVPFLKKKNSPMFFPTMSILGKEIDQAYCWKFFESNKEFFKNGC